MSGALFALVFMSMMLTVYPLAGWSVVGICLVVAAWHRLDGERQRRQALAVRADWEHHTLMARPLPPVRAGHTHGTKATTVQTMRSPNPAPWQLASLLPTTPLRMGRITR